MSVKRVEVAERIWGDSLPIQLLSCESWIFVKQKPDRKKQKPKKANYALQHVRTESRCMRIKIVLNFSWRRSLLYRNQSIDLQNKSMDCFLFDMGFRIHWNTFLDCDKIIDICASKYQRRMLLINPLSKN